MASSNDLERIGEGLRKSGEILAKYRGQGSAVAFKDRGDPVTEADLEVDTLLREYLPQPGDGWLSEETADDPNRLRCSRVWIVDPIDGTREFVQGIPEWCISIGLVEDGKPLAGGIYNPMADQLVLGSIGTGVTLNGEPVVLADTDDLPSAVVLASRSEVKRGEWDHYGAHAFELRPTGSVAYKLGMVAGGLCQATWTLVPKSEWDVAAGVALVLAAGGKAYFPDGSEPSFNNADPRLPGLIATVPGLVDPIEEMLSSHRG